MGPVSNKMGNADCYFAYGSNMNPERVAQRGLRVADPVLAVLPNFRLAFNKCSQNPPLWGHANIVYEPGARVEGLLYALAANDEILKMDPFERAPWNYGRDQIEVLLPNTGERRWTWTYFANPAVLVEGLLPEQSYLDHLLAGAPWLSGGYVDQLKALQPAIAQRAEALQASN